MCNENPAHNPYQPSPEEAPQAPDVNHYRVRVRQSALDGLEKAPVVPRDDGDYISMT